MTPCTLHRRRRRRRLRRHCHVSLHFFHSLVPITNRIVEISPYTWENGCRRQFRRIQKWLHIPFAVGSNLIHVWLNALAARRCVMGRTKAATVPPTSWLLFRFSNLSGDTNSNETRSISPITIAIKTPCAPSFIKVSFQRISFCAFFISFHFILYFVYILCCERIVAKTKGDVFILYVHSFVSCVYLFFSE